MVKTSVVSRILYFVGETDFITNTHLANINGARRQTKSKGHKKFINILIQKKIIHVIIFFEMFINGVQQTLVQLQ